MELEGTEDYKKGKMEVELSIEERKLLDELHGSPMVKPLQADLMETEDFGDEVREGRGEKRTERNICTH